MASSERVPDDAFEVLVRAEGTWHEAMRPQNTAETRLAIEARRARASETALRADLAKAQERIGELEKERNHYAEVINGIGEVVAKGGRDLEEMIAYVRERV